MTDLEQRLREALHEDAQRARLVNPNGPPAPEARSLIVDHHRRPSGRKLVAVAAAIVLLAAASVAVIQDRDRAPDVNYVGDLEDQAIADGAVLTVDDMPVGWEAAPPEVEAHWQDDLEQALAECLDIDRSELRSDRPSASSAFVNSSQQNDERVVSHVTVFASESAARADIDRFRDGAMQRCYLDVVEQQIADGAREGVTTISGRVLSGDDVEVGESTITPLSVIPLVGGSYPPISDDYTAFRVLVPLSSEGVDVDVYADFAFVRTGRVTVQASFQTFFGDFGGGGVRYAPGEDGSSVVEVPDTNAPQPAAQLIWKVLERIPDSVVDQPLEPDEPLPAVDDPPALPEPGEQPADAAAAEAQVRAAFIGIFDASQPREQRAQLSERPAVWSDANRQLMEGQYGSMVEDLQAGVDEVVFTSPTHAAVRFEHIAADTIVPTGPFIGDAVLVDGRWLVAITTTCDRVGIAGVVCDMRL